MGKWNTILRWAMSPIRSPQRAIAGAGAAAKTATVGAGAAYVGWQALVNDKPVVETVGETLVGKETNAAIKEGVHGTVSAAADTVGAAKEAVVGASEAIGSFTGSGSGNGGEGNGASWGGIGEFFRNITGGNGVGMIGNLLGNIFSGKVSMMSMLGLVASGLLLFGRFGWMGKIAGALMGMLLIGNNSKVVQQAQPRLTEANPENRHEETPAYKPTPYAESSRPTIRR